MYTGVGGGAVAMLNIECIGLCVAASHEQLYIATDAKTQESVCGRSFDSQHVELREELVSPCTTVYCVVRCLY